MISLFQRQIPATEPELDTSAIIIRAILPLHTEQKLVAGGTVGCETRAESGTPHVSEIRPDFPGRKQLQLQIRASVGHVEAMLAEKNAAREQWIGKSRNI